MSNYQTGHAAEVVAAEYLEELGYEIVELNWKTPTCEIDIVAKKNGKIFFVEVKSRKTENFGSGLDYITPKKLKQMRYAAEFWMAKNNSDNCQLAALSLDAGVPSLVLID